MLKKTFPDYLCNQQDKELQRSMTAHLIEAGLPHHADCLRAFAADGPGAVDNPWTPGALHCGPHPLTEASTLDVWFDTVELTPHVYLAEHEEAAEHELGWYALHPVFVWQYLGFVRNFKYKLTRTPAVVGGPLTGLFSTIGMDDRPELDFATEVYYFEAVCYAAWFGKWLIGERITYLADILSPALLTEAVPAGLNFWDGIGYRREDDPTAFNLKTADYEYWDDLETLDLPNEMKVIYEQWERNCHTGLSAYRPSTGAEELAAGEVYPHLIMKNAVARI